MKHKNIIKGKEGIFSAVKIIIYYSIVKKNSFFLTVSLFSFKSSLKSINAFGSQKSEIFPYKIKSKTESVFS